MALPTTLLAFTIHYFCDLIELTTVAEEFVLLFLSLHLAF